MGHLTLVFFGIVFLFLGLIFLGVGIHGASGTPLMPPTYTTTKMRPKPRGGHAGPQKAGAQFGKRQSAACPISGRTCFSVAAAVFLLAAGGCVQPQCFCPATRCYFVYRKWFCSVASVICPQALLFGNMCSRELHADYNNTGNKDRASKLRGPARPNLRNVPKIRK